MENRNFQMGTQWNIVHYPEKPTGFGILIIGDERHFVDESKCYWTQNEGKLTIINQFKESGYTIFSSNLFGKNWGSDHAVELAQKVYHRIIRSEIINNKIHVLAEGMGALVAVRLMKIMNEQLRSVVLLNPILSLKNHIEQEKDHKFFYKKIMNELSIAYQRDRITLENDLQNMDSTVDLELDIPIKIYHILSGGKSYNQAKKLPQLLRKTDIRVNYLVPEKKPQLGLMIVKFFNSHEKHL